MALEFRGWTNVVDSDLKNGHTTQASKTESEEKTQKFNPICAYSAVAFMAAAAGTFLLLSKRK